MRSIKSGTGKTETFKRSQMLATLFFLILATTIYAQKKTDLYDIKIKKVKDDIYLAYREEPLRPFVEGNVVIIINETDVILVDAGGAPASARNVIAKIKELTPNPVRYIINTHIHRDHKWGIQEYLKAFPNAEYIAHSGVRETVLGGSPTFVADSIKRLEASQQQGKEEIKRLREEGKPGNEKIIAHLERYYNQDIYTMLEEYKSVVNIAPTQTFEEKIAFHRKKRTIEALFLGKGDTPDDVVVYLPDDKVVISGDLVVHPIPYGFSVQPLEWAQTLGRLSKLDFDTLIPGHGEVQKGRVYLQRVSDLLQSVEQQVKAGVEAGLGLDDVRKKVDLTRFENEFSGDDPIYHYYFREYFSTPNVERTFNQLKAQKGQK